MARSRGSSPRYDMENPLSTLARRIPTRTPGAVVKAPSPLRPMKFPLPAAIGGLLLAAVFLSSARAAELPKGATPVLGALRTELDRSFAAFKTQPTPAYFLSYEVTENHSFEMGATNGALLKSSENQTRQLDIDLRVGDPKLEP